MKQKLLIGLFLTVIFGLGLFSLIKKDVDFSDNENRFLTQLPRPSVQTVFDGSFSSEYESYVTDQFVWRDQWIGLKSYAERALMKTESNGVFFCRDGYLMEDHGYEEFTSDLADGNKKALLAFAKKYEEYGGGGHLSILLVPTASQILEKKLPPFASPYNQKLLLDEIRQKTGDTYVDVAEKLEKHREEALYYRTDHHWTTLGAYYGYAAWADQMGEKAVEQDEFEVKEVTDQFYGTLSSKVNIPMKPDAISLYYPKEKQDYELVYDMGTERRDGLYDMEKLKVKDKYAVFLGGNYGVVEINSSVKNGKSLVMVKDSFSHSIAPFLANHYEKIYMVDLRYFNMGMDRFLKELNPTDIMVLYNTSNLVTDRNVKKIAR